MRCGIRSGSAAALRMLAICVPILAATDGCTAAKLSPHLAWMHSRDVLDHQGYAFTRDADSRRESGLLLVETREGLVQVGEDLKERLVGTRPLPRRRDPMEGRDTRRSLSGRFVFTLGAETPFVDTGCDVEPSWLLPAAVATLHELHGGMLATIRDTFDEAFVSDDGRTIVTVPGPCSVMTGAWHETPFHGAMFFDATGRRSATLVDDRADFDSAELSADGSLFVHVSDGSVVAHDGAGRHVWSAPLQHECVMGRLVVSPHGRIVAVPVALDDTNWLRPGVVTTRVLDGSGRAIPLDGRAAVDGWPEGISADERFLLVVRPGDGAEVFDLQAGKRTWAVPPLPGPGPRLYPRLWPRDRGALDAHGRRVALLGSGMTKSIVVGGWPDRLLLEVWDTAKDTQILAWEIGSDELPSGGNPNLRPRSMQFSDDGKWLLVDGDGWLFLFRLP